MILNPIGQAIWSPTQLGKTGEAIIPIQSGEHGIVALVFGLVPEREETLRFCEMCPSRTQFTTTTTAASGSPAGSGA